MSDNNSMKEEALDQLFQKADTQKNIPLSDGAWNRLDDMLSVSDQPKNRWMGKAWLSIAASLAIIIAVLFSVNKSESAYLLEELPIAQVESIYNSEALAEIDEYRRKTTERNGQAYNNADSKLIVVN